MIRNQHSTGVGLSGTSVLSYEESKVRVGGGPGDQVLSYMEMNYMTLQREQYGLRVLAVLWI